jgi:hypothetical protein
LISLQRSDGVFLLETGGLFDELQQKARTIFCSGYARLNLKPVLTIA